MKNKPYKYDRHQEQIIANRFFEELDLLKKHLSKECNVEINLHEPDLVEIDGYYFWKEDKKSE